jgi:hypothetical protein
MGSHARNKFIFKIYGREKILNYERQEGMAACHRKAGL